MGRCKIVRPFIIRPSVIHTHLNLWGSQWVLKHIQSVHRVIGRPFIASEQKALSRTSWFCSDCFESPSPDEKYLCNKPCKRDQKSCFKQSRHVSCTPEPNSIFVFIQGCISVRTWELILPKMTTFHWADTSVSHSKLHSQPRQALCRLLHLNGNR